MAQSADFADQLSARCATAFHKVDDLRRQVAPIKERVAHRRQHNPSTNWDSVPDDDATLAKIIERDQSDRREAERLDGLIAAALADARPRQQLRNDAQQVVTAVRRYLREDLKDDAVLVPVEPPPVPQGNLAEQLAGVRMDILKIVEEQKRVQRATLTGDDTKAAIEKFVAARARTPRVTPLRDGGIWQRCR